MSSTIFEAIKKIQTDVHNVGALNNWNKSVINLGAKVAGSDIDNWELVELEFNSTSGERECKRLTAATNRGYLIASVEDYMGEYETIKNFFNAQGERARIVQLDPGVRFEVSNFVPENSTLTTNPLKNGQKVHWDTTTKKFKISNVTSNGVAGYSTAANQFVVVDVNGNSIDGQQTIRLEVTK